MGTLRESAYAKYDQEWHRRKEVYDCPINTTVLIDDIQQVVISSLNGTSIYYYKISPYPDSHWMGA